MLACLVLAGLAVFQVVVYALFGVVILDRAEFIDVLPEAFSCVGIWVLTAYFALGTVINAVSRSKPEQRVMTPTALALAVLFLVVALT